MSKLSIFIDNYLLKPENLLTWHNLVYFLIGVVGGLIIISLINLFRKKKGENVKNDS